MPTATALSSPIRLATSCGTLIINSRNQILLCHVTGTGHWDIPKGLQDEGEAPLAAAMRELREETGLAFPIEAFEEIGDFDYRRDKRLHLFKVYSGDSLQSLSHLHCTSHFPHHITGKPTPEMDGFRWARVDELRQLCWPRMAQRLLSLEW